MYNVSHYSIEWNCQGDLVNFMLSGSGIFIFFYIFFETYSMIYLNALKTAEKSLAWS